MSQLGLSFQFVDGVRPDQYSDVEEGYARAKRLSAYGYDLALGEIGCFFAHRRAWNIVRAENGPCLILEDDALLGHVFPALLDQWARSSFPMIRLAAIFEKRHRMIDGGPYAKYWGDPGGAAAYVLTPATAARLLEKSERFHMAVDDFLEARFIHGIPTYAFLPYPVRQSGSPSQIACGKRPPLRYSARVKRMLLQIPVDINKYFRRVLYFYF